jgi:hypothetical protein
MSKSHREVVNAFAKGKEYTGHNVFARNGILYSYGEHFPLAVKRDGWYLLNGDKYSPTTSQHQSLTFSAFRESPRVSFTAIRAAGIDYRTCELVDFTKDDYRQVLPSQPDFDNFRSLVPVGATYYEWKHRDGEIYNKGYHRIGAIVLKQDEKYFICGMDEGSYFVSQLPHPVTTVAEAYESLMPQQVKNAIGNGQNVIRQGEWFFIPTTRQPPWEKDYKKSAELPHVDGSNAHIVTRLWMSPIGDILCKGTVRHKSLFGGRADHKMVKLGNIVHMAVKNTSLGDWSARGRVD